ncbi:unnamed protein product [Dibothriocephalus latus]|uniref:Uncharacterized protein n=1 Tax=Dibothriocephalus latus TaxID=60516 RepID=A0A3P6VAH5_DIBLA|nr:unnamed protein product [Dibothriocephalus latus]
MSHKEGRYLVSAKVLRLLHCFRLINDRFHSCNHVGMFSRKWSKIFVASVALYFTSFARARSQDKIMKTGGGIERGWMAWPQADAWRLRGDDRVRNKITLSHQYPVPYLQDFAGDLFDKSAFSRVHTVLAFHQIPIALEDESSHREAGFRSYPLAWDAPGPQNLDTGLPQLSTEQVASIQQGTHCHAHPDTVGLLHLLTGCSYRLTCVDRFTRWPKAIPMPDVVASTVFKAFSDLDYFTAELVFGATVRLSSEMISSSNEGAVADPINPLHVSGSFGGRHLRHNPGHQLGRTKQAYALTDGAVGPPLGSTRWVALTDGAVGPPLGSTRWVSTHRWRSWSTTGVYQMGHFTDGAVGPPLVSIRWVILFIEPQFIKASPPITT